jgi:hypothetical protein
MCVFLVILKLKKKPAKKNLNSILFLKMEDGERGNFVTVRFEGKFRNGELSREQRRGRFLTIEGDRKAAL